MVYFKGSKCMQYMYMYIQVHVHVSVNIYFLFQAPDPSEKNNYYACPLYSDYRNKDFITTVHIPTFSDFTVDHWTVQGPTMFPHTDY